MLRSRKAPPGFADLLPEGMQATEELADFVNTAFRAKSGAGA
jgi:hypothetical protein